MAKPVVLVICAHSDDQIFGAGGTLARYSKEGKEILTYIFSYGEFSHPWLKSHISARIRLKESLDADEVIGGKGVQFFGTSEGKFLEEAKRMNLHSKLKKLIQEKKPEKIFTHSLDDPHPDHRAVFQLVTKALDASSHQCDVFTFDIWNWVSIKSRNVPKLVVDISPTFRRKIKALQQFRSQWMSLITLMPSVYIRAIMHGLKNRVMFAEVFRKVR